MCAQSRSFKKSIIKLACLIVGKSHIAKDGADVRACETPRLRCLILRDQYFMIVESDIPNLITEKNVSFGRAFSSPLEK